MNLEQRLALRGARPLLVALFSSGSGHAEALRELLHGILEPDLLVQLEELDDVAARRRSRSSGRTPCRG